MELYEQIRREYEHGAGTIRAVARKLGVHRREVRKALASAVPAERKIPERERPRLAAAIPFIDGILESDRQAPRKQRHTAHRIFTRLRRERPEVEVAESTVRRYVRERKAAMGLLGRETFVPQSYDHCLEYKKMNPKDRLGSILKHHGFINDHELATCLSKQIGWKFFKSDYIPDYRAIDQMGLDYFCTHQIFPLKNGGTPSFVVSFIDNVEITDFLKRNFGMKDVNFYIGTESDVRNALGFNNPRTKQAKITFRNRILKIGRDRFISILA